jgi:hypothetical protein
VDRGAHPRRALTSLHLRKIRYGNAGQKWRTGCEGRVRGVKRRHGLGRCRYKRHLGMDRWVGLGVIADNVVNIGRTIEKQAAPSLIRHDPTRFVGPPTTPAGFALPGVIDHNAANYDFAPESSGVKDIFSPTLKKSGCNNGRASSLAVQTQLERFPVIWKHSRHA